MALVMRSETGTITGLDAYIHIRAQRFILFGAINGARRLVLIYWAYFESVVKLYLILQLG